MKKIISLLLVLVTILSMTVLAGCAESSNNDEELSDEELLVGTWKGDFDFGNKLVEMLKKDQDNPLSEYMPENKELTLKITAKFTEDGEYKLTTTDDALDLFETFFREFFHETLTRYISDLAEENSMTVSEVLRALNVSSIDEFTEKVMDEADMDFNDFDLSKSADYTVDDGKIYISEDKSEYYTYKLDDDTLTFTGSEDEEANIYPMTFKRQE